jgi:hypothetical protein
MRHELPGLRPRPGKTEAIDNIIQPALQQLEKSHAGLFP